MRTTSILLISSLVLILSSHCGPVPVGGNVKVETETLFTPNSKMAAARLKCVVSRGTFPHVSWLFNNSALPSETHLDPGSSNYVLTDQGRTLLLAELGPETHGYYRCQARDSYDPSGPWLESTAVLVQVKGERSHTAECT